MRRVPPQRPHWLPPLAALAVAIVALTTIDVPLIADSRYPRTSVSSPLSEERSACEGAREPLPGALFYTLRTAAFPGSGRPDVAVHIPPGFDATRRPGLVVYFHGWYGCVAAALSTDDSACSDGGAPRAGADLATQVDDARVNALLVAVEVRADLGTGEPGQLAMPAGLRDLLRELFAERLNEPLGCPSSSALSVDSLDRVVVIAHSGGYQAAASTLALGDIPRITEVDLLDALYGADDVFEQWLRTSVDRFDRRVAERARFVDLYTCCGGTAARSLALARAAGDELGRAGLASALFIDDGEGELGAHDLEHPVVFKRVPRAHSALPGAYVRSLVEAAGFARVAVPLGRSHPLRPK